MPTEIEVRVMQMLAATEIPPSRARQIETMGSEAVTVVCEAALGSFPGIPQKTRANAAALLGGMTHPQARETVALLLRDPSPSLVARAIRAAGEQRLDSIVPDLDRLLRRPDTSALLAAEAVKALIAIGSPAARASLEAYAGASPDTLPHRASTVVRDILRARPREPR